MDDPFEHYFSKASVEARRRAAAEGQAGGGSSSTIAFYPKTPISESTIPTEVLQEIFAYLVWMPRFVPIPSASRTTRATALSHGGKGGEEEVEAEKEEKHYSTEPLHSFPPKTHEEMVQQEFCILATSRTAATAKKKRNGRDEEVEGEEGAHSEEEGGVPGRNKFWSFLRVSEVCHHWRRALCTCPLIWGTLVPQQLSTSCPCSDMLDAALQKEHLARRDRYRQYFNTVRELLLVVVPSQQQPTTVKSAEFQATAAVSGVEIRGLLLYKQCRDAGLLVSRVHELFAQLSSRHTLVGPATAMGIAAGLHVLVRQVAAAAHCGRWHRSNSTLPATRKFGTEEDEEEEDVDVDVDLHCPFHEAEVQYIYAVALSEAAASREHCLKELPRRLHDPPHLLKRLSDSLASRIASIETNLRYLRSDVFQTLGELHLIQDDEQAEEKEAEDSYFVPDACATIQREIVKIETQLAAVMSRARLHPIKTRGTGTAAVSPVFAAQIDQHNQRLALLQQHFSRLQDNQKRAQKERGWLHELQPLHDKLLAARHVLQQWLDWATVRSSYCVAEGAVSALTAIWGIHDHRLLGRLRGALFHMDPSAAVEPTALLQALRTKECAVHRWNQEAAGTCEACPSPTEPVVGHAPTHLWLQVNSSALLHSPSLYLPRGGSEGGPQAGFGFGGISLYQMERLWQANAPLSQAEREELVEAAEEGEEQRSQDGRDGAANGLAPSLAALLPRLLSILPLLRAVVASKWAENAGHAAAPLHTLRALSASIREHNGIVGVRAVPRHVALQVLVAGGTHHLFAALLAEHLLFREDGLSGLLRPNGMAAHGGEGEMSGILDEVVSVVSEPREEGPAQQQKQPGNEVGLEKGSYTLALVLHSSPESPHHSRHQRSEECIDFAAVGRKMRQWTDALRRGFLDCWNSPPKENSGECAPHHHHRHRQYTGPPGVGAKPRPHHAVRSPTSPQSAPTGRPSNASKRRSSSSPPSPAAVLASSSAHTAYIIQHPFPELLALAEELGLALQETMAMQSGGPNVLRSMSEKLDVFLNQALW